MTNVVTIEQSEGVVTINEDLLRGYLSEAFEHLAQIEEGKQGFKDVVEAVADATNLKPAKVSKYFKQRFEAKTKQTKELGELFTKLDDVLSGKETEDTYA